MKIERRMAVSGLEVREDSGTLTLTGYASTFNQPYEMGWYSETVDPGAFRRTLGRSPDVRLLVNHDGLPLARTTSGTLSLETDERGLRVSANLDASDPDVQRIAPKMQRGDLNQMSFGFYTDKDSWNEDLSKRTLQELDLNNGDVSIVTYPANPNAMAGLRAGNNPHLEAIQAAIRTLEARDASPASVLAVLGRALKYFSAIDDIVDAAQEEIADTLAVPNPDEPESWTEPDGDEMPMGDMAPMTGTDMMRAASLVRQEAAKRRLRLIG